jgi:membrane-associated phospholipid phosphatase
VHTILALALTFPLIVPFYLMLPACGPAYAFPGFPFVHPSFGALHLVALDAAPNAFPSGHMATALVVGWYLRRWKAGLVAGAIFAALTALATMATGQHYCIDLVFAVPYAALVVFVAEHAVQRVAMPELTSESTLSQ